MLYEIYSTETEDERKGKKKWNHFLCLRNGQRKYILCITIGNKSEDKQEANKCYRNAQVIGIDVWECQCRNGFWCCIFFFFCLHFLHPINAIVVIFYFLSIKIYIMQIQCYCILASDMEDRDISKIVSDCKK